MTATPEERAVIEAARREARQIEGLRMPSDGECALRDAVRALDRSAKRAEAERRARLALDKALAGHAFMYHSSDKPAVQVVADSMTEMKKLIHAAIVDLLMEREG